MYTLLIKDIPFEFTEECMQAFKMLKEKLTSISIIIAPDWSFPFKIMGNASDYVIRPVLGQRNDKRLHAIYYASRVLNDA